MPYLFTNIASIKYFVKIIEQQITLIRKMERCDEEMFLACASFSKSDERKYDRNTYKTLIKIFTLNHSKAVRTFPVVILVNFRFI